VVWQGSAGDCRPYADLARHSSTIARERVLRLQFKCVDYALCILATKTVQTSVKGVPMRTMKGLHVLLVSATLCGMVQTVVGQSSARAEVLAALAERDKAFVAGDETKVAQLMSEDYLQTDVSGNIQDKQAWLSEYYRPLAPMLKSGKTRMATFNRSGIMVRDFGDTMVVAGQQTLKFVGVNPWNPNATYLPGPPLTLRFTHVWIKRGGAWKLAVVHNAVPWESK